jgi:FecR protein
MKHAAMYTVFALMAFLAGCGGHGKHGIFGSLAYVTGTAQVFGTASGSWAPAQNGASVCAGDSIKTSKESEAVVTFGNNTIKLSENTCITISDTVDEQNKRLIAVLNIGGVILSDVKDIEQHGTRYEIWTPTAVAHAEGTDFVVAFSPQPYVTNVRVLDGRVRVFNPFMPSAPQVLVSPGCYTTVACDEAPVAPAPMNCGQFKKMQHLLGPRYYHDYETKFKINPDEMPLDAPIVVVSITATPMFLPPSPPLPLGPHGRPGPFLLPPGPGMSLPRASHGGMVAHVQALPPGPGVMPLPHTPHGDMTAQKPPLPPGFPTPQLPKASRIAAPSPAGSVPSPHGEMSKVGHGGGNEKGGNHDEGGKGKHKGNKK